MPDQDQRHWKNLAPEQPDMILMDIQLPDMEGTEVTRQDKAIRQRKYRLLHRQRERAVMSRIRRLKQDAVIFL